jgi:hypothetical protein
VDNGDPLVTVSPTLLRKSVTSFGMKLLKLVTVRLVALSRTKASKA